MNIKEVLAPARTSFTSSEERSSLWPYPGYGGREFFEVVTHDSDGRLASIASWPHLALITHCPGMERPTRDLPRGSVERGLALRSQDRKVAILGYD